MDPYLSPQLGGLGGDGMGPVLGNPNMLAQAIAARRQPRPQLSGPATGAELAQNLGMVPGLGLLGVGGDISQYIDKPETRGWLPYALTAAGAIPFLGALAKMAGPLPRRVLRSQAGAISGGADDAQKIAQRNAAKPVSEGGLGLSADNTALDRAKAMGFTTEGYRGSSVEEISHAKPVWWSEDPQYASAYAAKLRRPPKGQPDDYAGNVMPLLVKLENEKNFTKFNVGGVPDAGSFGGFGGGVTTGLRRYGSGEQFGPLSGKVWEALTLPENVRSRFAAFDPLLMGQPGLLK